MRAISTLATSAAAALALVAGGVQAGVGGVAAAHGPATEYVVVYADPAAAKAARRAVEAAGGTVLRENAAIGTALVRAPSSGFLTAVRRGGAVLGAAHNIPIGHAPDLRPAREAVERLTPAERGAALKARPSVRKAAAAAAAPYAQEPLAPRQWDMAAIGATAVGSYATEPGDRRVRVGVIDTGIDGSHPDIAPNFDPVASRNFTTDIPASDGPCEVPSCVDPADVDDDGHGTHVASTIASPVNGLGVAGVAPNVTLVNVRAGQDSGFFFVQPTVDALTYAADIRLDVVNMSFYVDPWLYNCAANPADSPEDRAEQQAIVEAVQRAVDYAVARGVTPIAALGNERTDLGEPSLDDTSPDYPEDTAYDRTVDNTCLTVPTETEGVISISATGPSGRKAAYSNYGLEQTDLAAPGGDAYDNPDNKIAPTSMVLAAYPERLARANGDIDAEGRPTTAFVVQDCANGVCAYYQYLQGTSMAAPHAAGVAALAVSRFGTVAPDGDIGLDPRLTTAALWLSAERRPCPSPATFTYVLDRPSGRDTFQHHCEESFTRNGFFGHGVVNAAAMAQIPLLSGGPGDPDGRRPPTPPAPPAPPSQQNPPQPDPEPHDEPTAPPDAPSDPSAPPPPPARR